MAKSDIFRLSGITRQKAFKKAIQTAKSTLNDQLDTYLKMFELTGSTSQNLVDEVIQERDTELMLREIWYDVAPTFAKRTYEAIKGGKVKFEFSDSAFNIWLENEIAINSSALVTKITETTRSLIKERLAEMTREGLSIQKMAKRIKDDGAKINFKRAIKIARTEVIKSSNMASLHAAQQGGSSLLKIWIPAHQKRTRGYNPKDKFDHYHMDKHPAIELDALFDVSGDKLQHPGDVKNGAQKGNTIQCRCAIGYKRRPNA